MPAIQTTYGTTIAPAYEGMVADSREQTILSLTVEGAGIGFGKAVMQGAADKTVKNSTAGGKLRGVSVATHFAGFTAGLQGTKDTYDVGETIPVMTMGSLWVLASVAVAPGDPVYVVPASGVFTNVTTGNTLLSPAAIFETSTTGPGLAVIAMK
jgi:hypothetical protein